MESFEKTNSERPENRPEKKERGRNVTIHVVFLRHGEKGPSGELAPEGVRQATEYGEKMIPRDAVKGYSSPIQRVIDTVERVIKSAPHEKKLKTRVKAELGIPPFSKESAKRFSELEKDDADAAADWYLSFGSDKPDRDTTSPHEVAKTFAYLVQWYGRMAKKLYSKSEVDLINGTHQALPMALLKEVLIRRTDDKEIVGFDKVEEIGGALKPTEEVEFLIKTDEMGHEDIKVILRGAEYDINMQKMNALAESYLKDLKNVGNH